jgi:hypothetical protein
VGADEASSIVIPSGGSAVTPYPRFLGGFFLCFVRFFTVVDSSRRAVIVPGFVVDSSHPFMLYRY